MKASKTVSTWKYESEQSREQINKMVMEKIAREYGLTFDVVAKLEKEKKEIENQIYELEKKRDALKTQLNGNGTENKELESLEKRIKQLRLTARFIENARHDMFWTLVNLWNAIIEKENIRI
jgi:predicted  nucleic acid-binding Zn-ribbon protein